MNLSKKALIANIILLLMELAGFIVMIAIYGDVKLKYYTNWSNIFGLLSAVFFIINYCIKENSKVFKEILKYTKLTSVICLVVTFLVVNLTFVPGDHFNFYKWSIKDNFFSFHFLSPIIATVTFILFERYDFKYVKDTIIGMIFTIVYSIIISILILAKKVIAPYPFLDYYANSVIVNVITVTSMLIIIILILFLLIFVKIRQNKRTGSEE